MKFPKRVDAHIKESAGWKIFQMNTPAEWIIREVTERDYGIDAYIELIHPNGDVRGDLCSIQLKASQFIEWKDHKAKLSIKKSTVNYWMYLPIPIFLCWVDISELKVYFCSVKDRVRKQYFNYTDNKKEYMEFIFVDSLELKNSNSHQSTIAFMYSYFFERDYKQFYNYVLDILIHCADYYRFILSNQYRDFHLEVEEECHFMMMHIYNICKFMSSYFNIKCEIISLEEAYKNDENIFKDSFCKLHEATLTQILEQLHPIYIKVLKSIIKLILEDQEEYWRTRNPLIYNHYLSITYTFKSVEEYLDSFVT